MIWIQFVVVAAVIVLAGARLARYGDVLGEKTGLGGNWVGVVLLAATTSLPELFTTIGSTALAALPDIAVGGLLGSCMLNLLILSLIDALQPQPLGRALRGHLSSIGFGLLLTGIAGVGLLGGTAMPSLGAVGIYTPVLIVLYFVSMRLIFTWERQRLTRETEAAADGLQYGEVPLRTAVVSYTIAAVLVVGSALLLPLNWRARPGWGRRLSAVSSLR